MSPAFSLRVLNSWDIKRPLIVVYTKNRRKGGRSRRRPSYPTGVSPGPMNASGRPPVLLAVSFVILLPRAVAVRRRLAVGVFSERRRRN